MICRSTFPAAMSTAKECTRNFCAQRKAGRRFEDARVLQCMVAAPYQSSASFLQLSRELCAYMTCRTYVHCPDTCYG